MSAPLRVALLGLEHPHCNSWQRAIHAAPEGTLAGIWSATPGLATEKAPQFDCAAFASPELLVEQADAVAICSPTAQHAELIELAAARGMKILCEKPIGASEAECRRIERAVREHDAWYMQGFPKRFDPVNHEIQALLRDGAIGEPFLVRVRHGHPFAALDPGFAAGWFADREQAGGGALIDEGVHGADFLRWQFGEPEYVSAVLGRMVDGRDVELTGTAVYRYASGLVAEITSSWLFLGADNSVEIFGSEGTIVVSGVDLGSRDLTSEGFMKHFVRPVPAPGADPHALLGEHRAWTLSTTVPQFKQDTDVFHQNVARSFVEHAASGRPPPVTLEDGLGAARMIFAAYRAAASGRIEPIAGATTVATREGSAA